jgi:hypothetical protein
VLATTEASAEFLVADDEPTLFGRSFLECGGLPPLWTSELAPSR